MVSVFGIEPHSSGYGDRLRHINWRQTFHPAMHGTVVSARKPVLALWLECVLTPVVAGGWPTRRRTSRRRLGRWPEDSNHPFSLAYALYHVGFFNAIVSVWNRHTHATELAAVAKKRLPRLEGLELGPLGVVSCAFGRRRGIALTERVSLYSGLTTPPVFWAPLLALRSIAFAMAGQPQRALELVDAAIAAIGYDESDSPEFRILRGDYLSQLPERDLVAVEDSYRAAMRGARNIGARLTELHAATNLVNLLRSQNRPDDGVSELRSLYETFTEGFAEPELVAARTKPGSTKRRTELALTTDQLMGMLRCGEGGI